MAITRAGSVTTATSDITELNTFSSAQLAGLLTDETGSGLAVFGTGPSLTRPVVVAPIETATISATAATGTVPFDILTHGVLYYTSNATANWTLNFRGNGSTTLSSLLLTVGSAVTCVFVNTNGTTAYYPTAFQIDGVSVTPKWQLGIAPTAGSPSALDAYSFTIIKTALTPSYVVLASHVKFA
jgi:hypothetical protein